MHGMRARWARYGYRVGSASASTAIHGITYATARPGIHTSPGALAFHAAAGTSSSPASDLALQSLDGHLNRMADAATNSGLTLSQLTDANTRLASATSTQYQAIKKLLTNKMFFLLPQP